MLVSDLTLFNVPDSWKLSEKEYEPPTTHKTYNFINKYYDINDDLVKLIEKELLIIISVLEDRDQYINLLDHPFFTFKNGSTDLNDLLTCPICETSINNNDTLILMRQYDKKDKKDKKNECKFYIVTKENFNKYLINNYFELGNDKLKFNEEQVKGEILNNQRWGNEIIDRRREKEIFYNDIKNAIEYFKDLLNNYEPSIIRNINEEIL